jgi:hypothetical protein
MPDAGNINGSPETAAAKGKWRFWFIRKYSNVL